MKVLVNGPTEEMIAKLPQWARHHIDHLSLELGNRERQIQRLEEERRTLTIFEEPETRISWEYLMEGAHPLTSHASIRFYVGEKVRRDNWITARWRESDQKLDINASTTLIIEPQASNSIYVTTQER